MIWSVELMMTELDRYCELQILVTDVVFVFLLTWVHHKLHFELTCMYLKCDVAHSLGKPLHSSSLMKTICCSTTGVCGNAAVLCVPQAFEETISRGLAPKNSWTHVRRAFYLIITRMSNLYLTVIHSNSFLFKDIVSLFFCHIHFIFIFSIYILKAKYY